MARDGVRLFKYYLDIGKREQKQRLRDRRRDPLKQWKLSPVDVKAPKLLLHLDYKGRNKRLLVPDADIVFPFSEETLARGLIHP